MRLIGTRGVSDGFGGNARSKRSPEMASGGPRRRELANRHRNYAIRAANDGASLEMAHPYCLYEPILFMFSSWRAFPSVKASPNPESLKYGRRTRSFRLIEVVVSTSCGRSSRNGTAHSTTG